MIVVVHHRYATPECETFGTVLRHLTWRLSCSPDSGGGPTRYRAASSEDSGSTVHLVKSPMLRRPGNRGR